MVGISLLRTDPTLAAGVLRLRSYLAVVFDVFPLVQLKIDCVPTAAVTSGPLVVLHRTRMTPSLYISHSCD